MSGPAPEADPATARRVPVSELVDLERLGRGGRPPTPAELRAALPPGWVLEPDGRTARRDRRVLHRGSWVLLLALVSFGAAGVGLFWMSFPRGAAGLLRLAGLLVLLVLAGGVVAPAVTRALNRRG